MLFENPELGADLSIDSLGESNRLDALLFGESQGRVLVSVSDGKFVYLKSLGDRASKLTPWRQAWLHPVNTRNAESLLYSRHPTRLRGPAPPKGWLGSNRSLHLNTAASLLEQKFLANRRTALLPEHGSSLRVVILRLQPVSLGLSLRGRKAHSRPIK